MSGPMANAGDAVFRNVLWAVERVNARGGVLTPLGPRMLELVRYDNKGSVEAAVSVLRSAIDDGAHFILQGNSSAIAAAIGSAVDKHNEREPSRRVVFLNYSAVEPSLTNEHCSFWHFRFDAHANMRLMALLKVLNDDKSISSAYLIGQDYSFGQAVLREARQQITRLRPDLKIVGDELHPMARVKDFAPYAGKIKASGADAVVTGNWGNDLTLLVRAARSIGYEGKFYTFYGNALGTPAAIGDAGVGKVVAVTDWLPNMPNRESEVFYSAYKVRFPRPDDDYVHMRMHMMVEALVQAIEQARSVEAGAVATSLEHVALTLYRQRAWMRPADHQFQQPLVVGVMDRKGTPGVRFDVEGSGYGFRVIRSFTAEQAEMPHTCVMKRPAL